MYAYIHKCILYINNYKHILAISIVRWGNVNQQKTTGWPIPVELYNSVYEHGRTRNQWIDRRDYRKTNFSSLSMLVATPDV